MIDKKPYKIRVQACYCRGTALVYARSQEEADDLCDVIGFNDIEWDADADFDIISVDEVK